MTNSACSNLLTEQTEEVGCPTNTPIRIFQQNPKGVFRLGGEFQDSIKMRFWALIFVAKNQFGVAVVDGNYYECRPCNPSPEKEEEYQGLISELLAYHTSPNFNSIWQSSSPEETIQTALRRCVQQVKDAVGQGDDLDDLFPERHPRD